MAKKTRSSRRGLRGLKGSAGPRGLKGAKGRRGPRGQRGATGVIGQRGKTGPAGTPGATGPRGLNQDSRVLKIIETRLEDVYHRLDVQFQRIAQLQAELDQIRSTWTKT